MSCIRFLIPALLFITAGKGQDNFTGYLQPSAALSYELSPRFSQNASLKQRTYFYRDSEGELRARHLDAVLFTKFRISANSSTSFGLQYRFRNAFDPDSGDEVRLTQQYNIALRPAVIRFGHRIRSEQRIFSDRTVHRFRYRLALDGPLQGQQTDVGEAYWIGSLEPLLSAGKGMGPEADLRLTAWLGYRINEGQKLQLGPEFRWEDFLGDLQNVLFFQAAWVISL